MIFSQILINLNFIFINLIFLSTLIYIITKKKHF